MMSKTNLSASSKDIKKTPVFNANKKAYLSKKYRVIANQGSTRSSKTFSVIQLLVWIADTQKTEISICSPSMPHLKKGAMKDFLFVLEDWGVFNEDDFNRTDHIYHFPRTGSTIEFFGADDALKLRGPGRKILFINEANLIPYASYQQLAIRTTDQIFIDFNPADEFSWVYTVADDPSNKLIVSTYRNNRANLSSGQILEIENMQNIDENLWKVFGLGQRGTSTETIYTKWDIVKTLPLKGEIFCGQDYGYNVPSALMMIEHYENELYVDEMLYMPKLTTNDLIEQYKLLDLSRTIEIFSDAAEPKTIEEVCRAGYNAIPADKDVLEGIRKVKGMKLHFTQRSANAIKEAKSYKWKIDKEGRVLDEPVKFNDHAMDAMRYGVFSKLAVDRYSWGALD